MFKKDLFIKKIFFSMLSFSILLRLADSINMLFDAIYGGNLLGEEALSIVSLILPLFYLITFCASLFGPGCAILFGIKMGEFKREEAYKYAGLSVVSSILIGIICGIVLICIKEPFFNFYNISGDLKESASAYYNWYLGLALIMPLVFCLYYLDLSDGDTFFPMLGSIGEVLINLVLSYVLCKKMGMQGLGIASFCSYIIALIFYSIHLLKKNNSIKFKLNLNLKNLKHSFKYSANSAFNNAFILITNFVINKIIIISCGNTYVSAYSTVLFVLSSIVLMGAVGDSAKGLCATYYGEKNYLGLKSVLNLCIRSIFVIGIILTIFFFVGAPLIPKIYGLESQELIDISITAVRIISVASIPFGICYFGYQIYTSIGKPNLSLLFTFLFNLFTPLILCGPFAFILDFLGIVIARCLAIYMALILFCLILLFKNGKKGFPYYLPDDTNIYKYDFVLSNDSLISMRNKINEHLVDHHYKSDAIELLFEEFFLRIQDKNPNKKVCIECTLMFEDDLVRIIVKDNGKITNIIEHDDAKESLNSFMLSHLLDKIDSKEYLFALSVNRNNFTFKRD